MDAAERTGARDMEDATDMSGDMPMTREECSRAENSHLASAVEKAVAEGHAQRRNSGIKDH